MGKHSHPTFFVRLAASSSERLLISLSAGAMFTVGLIIVAPLPTIEYPVAAFNVSPRYPSEAQATTSLVPLPVRPTQDTTPPLIVEERASEEALNSSLTTVAAQPSLTAPPTSTRRTEPTTAVTASSRSTQTSTRVTPPPTTPPVPQVESTPESPVSNSKCNNLGVADDVVVACNDILTNVSGVTSVGGRAGRAGVSCHPLGLALDFMVSPSVGDRVAAYVLAHQDRLGAAYVIWSQRINNGSGWSSMEDRGTDTANHYDHVHVSFRPCQN